MSRVPDDIASSLLQPDGWAYLDWVSGAIRVNATYEELERLRRLISISKRIPARELRESDLLLLETLVHEYTHYFQLCTTGYMYRVAKEFLTTFYSTVPQEIRDVEQLPHSVLADLGLRLDAIKQRCLLTIGAQGLDVLSIVESAAFLVQKRYSYPELSAGEYENALAGQPGIFRRGYEVAREYLGTSTFRAYPLLASLSLWTESPVDSLLTLCSWIAAHSSREQQQLQFGHLVDRLYRAAGFIGAPWIRGYREFPAYEASIRYLEDAGERGEFSRQAYLSEQYTDAQVGRVLAALPPVIFNTEQPGALGIQYPFSWEKRPQEENKRYAEVLLLALAISTHAQRIHADRASTA